MNPFCSPAAFVVASYLALSELRDNIRQFLLRRLGCRAVTSLEYGIIAGLIAIMILASLRNVGNNLSTTFNKLSTSM
jgi:pilus assembly protein Flp/PilA